MHENTRLARFFFFELLPGDMLKLKARANTDSAVGGGARDLRFPDQPFRPFMEKLFPGTIERETTRGGTRTTVTIHTGTLSWDVEREWRSITIEYHPPTLARPSEGRLARIPEIEPLVSRVPAAPDGRVLLVLAQDLDGRVTPQYVDEGYLRALPSNHPVAKPILKCIESANQAESDGGGPSRVMGYQDYASSGGQGTVSYCHEH
jgi:hypothetical protein